MPSKSTSAATPEPCQTGLLITRVRQGDLSAAQLLVNLGELSKSDIPSLLLEQAQAGNAPVLAILTASKMLADGYRGKALSTAATHGHLDAVRVLLPNTGQIDRNEALAMAARNGHTEVVAALIDVAQPKSTSSKALRLAASNGHTQAVKMLIPHSDPTDGEHQAIRMAAQHGHLEIVRMLIPFSSPEVRDSEPLMWSADMGHAEVVRLLLTVSSSQTQRAAALRSAAKRGHLDVVELLLTTSGDLSALLKEHGKDFKPEALTRIQSHLDAEALSSEPAAENAAPSAHPKIKLN